MNKKIFGGIAIVAIAVVVAFNVNLNSSKTNSASLLALANVEALADEEDDFVLPEMKGEKEYATTVECPPAPTDSIPHCGLNIDCLPWPEGTCEPFDPCNY